MRRCETVRESQGGLGGKVRKCEKVLESERKSGRVRVGMSESERKCEKAIEGQGALRGEGQKELESYKKLWKVREG